MDQIFAVRPLCKKYLGVNKETYVAFMDLEKVYDRVDIEKCYMTSFENFWCWR